MMYISTNVHRNHIRLRTQNDTKNTNKNNNLMQFRFKESLNTFTGNKQSANLPRDAPFSIPDIQLSFGEKNWKQRIRYDHIFEMGGVITSIDFKIFQSQSTIYECNHSQDLVFCIKCVNPTSPKESEFLKIQFCDYNKHCACKIITEKGIIFKPPPYLVKTHWKNKPEYREVDINKGCSLTIVSVPTWNTFYLIFSCNEHVFFTRKVNFTEYKYFYYFTTNSRCNKTHCKAVFDFKFT